VACCGRLIVKGLPSGGDGEAYACESNPVSAARMTCVLQRGEAIARRPVEGPQSSDSNGNLLSSAATTGGTSSFGYDSSNRVTSVSDPSGATTTFGYEESERTPSTITDDTGNVTSLVVTDGLVDSEGRLLSRPT
jgi:YD repeat-containing protein